MELSLILSSLHLCAITFCPLYSFCLHPFISTLAYQLAHMCHSRIPLNYLFFIDCTESQTLPLKLASSKNATLEVHFFSTNTWRDCKCRYVLRVVALKEIMVVMHPNSVPFFQINSFVFLQSVLMLYDVEKAHNENVSGWKLQWKGTLLFILKWNYFLKDIVHILWLVCCCIFYSMPVML